MKELGVLLDSQTGDIAIDVARDGLGLITGGFAVGNVERQNQALLINMYPGELKENPTVGVGIKNLQLSHDTLLYKHRIREQLEADGFRVNYLEIGITPDNRINIDINAKY